MKEIESFGGVHITKACERLAREAPAFMVFNGVRVEAKVGDSPDYLHGLWAAGMKAASEKYEAERRAYEQTPEGQSKLAAARERDAKEKRERNSILAAVVAAGLRDRFPWSETMGEISGFGGGYENACRDMVYAGLLWLETRPNADLSSSRTTDAKALDAHILKACPGCSGAMHGAAMNAVAYVAKNGWAKYAEAMTKRATA
jgi:hypothetical protein